MGAFRHKVSLPALPEGSERALIEQFKAIQSRLDGLERKQARLIPPVFEGLSVMANEGMLLRVAPPETTGCFVMLPQPRAENIGARITVAVVGGFLSPGCMLAIVGNVASINGQPFQTINSYRAVELVSCGDRGWFFPT